MKNLETPGKTGRVGRYGPEWKGCTHKCIGLDYSM